MLPQSFYGLRTSGISGGSYLANRDLQGGSTRQEPPPLQMPGCKQASKQGSRVAVCFLHQRSNLQPIKWCSALPSRSQGTEMMQPRLAP